MAEQPQLDFPVPPSAPDVREAKRKIGFGGFTRGQIFLGLVLVATIVWGMWVTRALTQSKQDHIVSARLSQAFMSSLDTELQRRSQSGQIVLVGEAVLTKNVPDITDSLKKAVFAAGVPEPKRLSVEELQRMQELAAAQSAVAASRAAPLATPGAAVDPMAGVADIGPLAPVAPNAPSQRVPAQVSGASVSTFGGPDGNGGQ